MGERKLWGEMEEEPMNEDLLQNVNFNPIIELGMQNIPEISISAQSSPVVLPKPNLITHTIQLHAYARQLSAIIAQSKKKRSFRLDAKNIPAEPLEPQLTNEHELTSPIAFLERKFSSFTLGQGPVILPFNPESHNRALRQCAAIAIGHVGIEWSTNSALTATADALDTYLTNFCKLLRTVVDKEAAGLESGFADIATKVLVEARVGDLKGFYETRVVKYHEKTKQKCDALRAKCERIAARSYPKKPKLELMPQLQFPMVMDQAGTSSMVPSFQMVQSMDQDQPQDIEFLDVVSTNNIRLENMQFSEPAPIPSTSGLHLSAKKKKK